MQISAITPHPTPHATLFLYMHPHARTHTFFSFSWVMKFVWPVFSHCLCHKLTMNRPNRAALPCSFSTPELNINAAWQQ